MGTDDWMALSYLSRHPAIDLVGVVVTGIGLAHLHAGTQNALSMLDFFGQNHVPVVMGAHAPLSMSNVFPPEVRVQMDAMDNITLPKSQRAPESDDVLTFYRRTVQKYGKVRVLSIGGLTHLAQVTHTPDVYAGIERLDVMGGAIRVAGNVADFGGYYPSNHSAEWNVFIDPLAAQQTLNSGVPMRWTTLDTSYQVPFSDSLFAQLQAQARTTEAKFVLEIMKHMDRSQFFFFDPLAAALLAEDSPTWATRETLGLSVVQTFDEEDDHSGQTVIDAQAPYRVDVFSQVDAAEFYQNFLSVLNT